MTMTVPEIERLLSIREAGAVLGVSPATFARMLARDELPIVKVGRRTLLDPADLRAFIKARKRLLNDVGPGETGPSVQASAGDGGGDDSG